MGWGKILAVGLALALTGCGGREAPRATGDVVVNAPRFGDTDPHPWDGRDPSKYAVHGIDASRWQGDIDWRAAQANGVSFAFFKATEGGDIVDPAFEAYWDGAGRAGVPRAAYHFFYFCRPAIEQARWFIKNVPRSKGALPPVLDMEWNAHSPTCTRRPDAAHVRAEAKIFMDALERHYGQRPVIYTTVDFFADNQMGRIGNVDFWLRSVAGHPSTVYPGQNWTFWQYSGTGLVPGITGKVDLNVFAGSRAEWRDWVARRAR
ncbi:GH25 family lysozyme [Pseudorhodobacter antarcticus]|nr:GH25 family lysozyme [Pseudorhodobacter antarcticus]